MASILRVLSTSIGAALLLAAPGAARGLDLRVGIVQAQAGDARKFQPLLEYLAAKGVHASFIGAPDYRAAADMFAAGKVDAMFGGSGIAGTLMIKELATPVVRGVAADGAATYRAVVIAPKGSPRFTGTADYFAGKRVIFAALASAGEFYFHSVGRAPSAVAMKAASHGAAIDALARGQADVAIVKDHVWEKERAKYPALEQVGADTGENPDASLVVSRRLPAASATQVAAALLALEADPSAAATAARGSLKLKGYVRATEADFAHTLGVLRKAGVTKDFAFAF